jgi:hydroxymethylpyrimidine kinase/phosphomethylpyrimidine kinase
VAVLKRELLPTSLLVTPNVPEAEALSGRTIESDAGVEEAARVIAGFGVAGVLIKGGHLLGPPDDTLFWDGQITRFPAERIETPRPVHGTGCLYSAAIAAYLARGAAVPAACESAKRFVEQAIRTALALGRGSLICPLGGEEPSGARVVR